MNLQTSNFKIHFTAAGKRQTIAGVDYAIYPSVILVEGVHHGMIGDPTMYPSQVLETSAPQWNNVPVTIEHPRDAAGAYVSAQTPEILVSWAVGRLINARYENGKLKADVMINIKKANSKNSNLIADLDRGVEMELSTGLFGEENKEGGQWNNEAFISTLTAITPDHLALLPGGVGACSHNDGCGIRANNGKGPKVNQTKAEYAPDKVNAVSHGDIHRQIRMVLDGKDSMRTSETGPYKYHFLTETYDNYFVYEEDSQDGSKYYRQSYSINADEKIVLSDDIIQVQKKVEYVPITPNANKEINTMAKENTKCCPDRVASLIANEASPYTATDSEWMEVLTSETLDKLEAPFKAKVDAEPDDLKANTADTQPTEAEVLTKFINEAPAPVRAVLNAGMRQLDAKRTELMGKIKANAKNQFTDDELKGMPDLVLEKMAASMATPEPERQLDYSGRGGFVPNAGGDSKEEAYVPTTMNFNKKAE